MKISTNQDLGELGGLSGVESEDIPPPNEPFDPASISIEPKAVPMDHVLRRLRQGSIRLAPSFQRKFVWDEAKKSQLIESLMLRIPLPMFYVAANPDGTWDVVDGLQRLTTIRDYLLGEERDSKGKKIIPESRPFRLTQLEFWGDRFNNKMFSDVVKNPNDSVIVNNIMETEMRFTVINPGTPEEVKRNIFKRINTGGMPLTAQEIRHALYQGISTDLLEKLSLSKRFKSAISNSIDDSRMAARELVLRFLAFFIIDRRGYDGDMDKYLANSMRVLNEYKTLSPESISKIFKKNPVGIQAISPEKIESVFEISMIRCRKLFGKYAFRKAVDGMRRTPINKALFEAWSTTLATISESDFSRLYQNREIFIDGYRKVLLHDTIFERSISRDSASIPSTRYRYMKIETLIKEALC